MSKNIKSDWIHEMCCPYCKQPIYRCYDVNDVPKDIKDDVFEDETEDWCSLEGDCDHFAYYDDYGFQGPSIKEKYKKELELIINYIDKDNDFNSWFYENDVDTIGKVISKLLPEYDYEIVRRSFDIGGGGKCNSGDPDVFLLFLKKK